ncbi:MAG: hypothetical protein LBF95_07620 [Treponema sp.]|jgi:hypothetical protein|nr:hypothetical protein [Treponema sp.]
MKDPILVVLAAGMGSRYGGLKQMDKLGSNGEALLDYSVFDALRSGFKKIIFIIRHDIEKDFREIVLARMGNAVPYSLAFRTWTALFPRMCTGTYKNWDGPSPGGPATRCCAPRTRSTPHSRS